MTLTPPQIPPQMIAVESIISETHRLLDKHRVVHDRISRTVSPATACFDNVVKPLIDVEDECNGNLAVIAMLQYASPVLEARQASEQAVTLMGQISSEYRARRDMYLLMKAVHDKGEKLKPEAQRYIDTELKDFQRFGHGVLSPAQIEQYARTRNKIDKLRREFNRNVREEDGGVWFDLGELDGVLEDDLARFERRRGENGKEQRFVRFRRAETSSVMKYATKASARKKLFIAEAFRFPQNDHLFKQIVVLRDENARMLGYSSHAEFRLEKRVAKTVGWVERLFNQLEEALTPVAQQEMNNLRSIKKKYIKDHGSSDQDLPDDMISPWDAQFYTRIASEKISVDPKKVAEFFPLEHVKPAMLGIFASYLQLSFVPAPPELVAQSKWHDDVEVWCVWDEREKSKGDFIGYLFLDLLWRPGKYKGNQCVTLQSGYAKDDGSRVHPATTLMCSFDSQALSPSPLLEHNQLVTMFHELGHGIHDLVSRTSYTAFHGYRAPPDFAEAPSIMLENWCWLPQELKKMSCHYTTLGAPTPEPIPDDMVASLVQSRDFNRGLWFLRQLAFSRYDLAVHSPLDHLSCEQMDLAAMFADIHERLSFVKHPCPDQRGHPHADFTHIVSGYDAGYYSYQAAHVFAADLYETAFAKDPRDLDSWQDYREGVLEPGGSRDAIEMLTAFLGHAPDPAALLKRFET